MYIALVIKVLKTIIYDVFSTLYKPFWAALLLSFMFMFLYQYAKEHGWGKENIVRKVFLTWIDFFKESLMFRKVFLLAFCTAMILLKTIFNRSIWIDPLGKLFENWWIYDKYGRLSVEPLENVILFMPFTILLLWTFGEKLIGEELTLKKIIKVTAKITGVFSLSVELFQLIFFVGTFQLSDLVYNILGGVIGGIIYYAGVKIKERMKRRN